MFIHHSGASILGFSIFTAICCFFPLGIAAIVFSVKVRQQSYGDAVSTKIPCPVQCVHIGPPLHEIAFTTAWPNFSPCPWSLQTKDAISAGDYNSARSRSSTAKILNIIALTIGSLFWISVVLAQLGWIIPYAIFWSIVNAIRRNPCVNVYIYTLLCS